jgi:biotin synthase
LTFKAEIGSITPLSSTKYMPALFEPTQPVIRHDWTLADIQALYALPFADLLFMAQQVHRSAFPANQIQVSTLLSIKTGACPEDCGYCSQSGHYKTGVEKQKLLDLDEVLAKAKQAKENGATRFCMGAGWRSPPDKQFPEVLAMVEQVKALGLETCLTAGMLSDNQATQLKEVGLDYYNHNLDTSPEYYKEIITTRTYQDRLDTLQRVRDNGINVCCGGILGMGETVDDRLNLLLELAKLQPHPESVPLNWLVPIAGTPLGDKLQGQQIDGLAFVRMVAVARIMLPHSFVRLSAGRDSMSDELQALCFLAGANSIHAGEKLLTTPLPSSDKDKQLFMRLGIKTQVEKSTEILAKHV